ncbi:M24 family metallopeptidase, partial [Candidatus Woesearchaeota archaeon]|nr:M24 family metallopeptidase [Candidatus Woesearchaeota archaeon]
AEYNGAIGDNACTVDLSGKYQDLVDASREALNNAISIIKPGLKINEIGKTISNTIKEKGFTAVSNLSGHGLDYNCIHCSPSIPNYDNGNQNEIKEGMIFAVEPFASSGAGKIYESGEATIFMLAHKRGVRNPIERLILREIDKYEGRPFASRWLCEKFSPSKVKFALKSLVRQEIIRAFPPLPDVDKGMVSQAEHTVLVTKDGCEVLTKSELFQ